MNKNVIIVILLCMVCALGGVIVGMNNSANRNSSKDTEKKENNKKSIDPNTLLDKIVGEWGRCDKAYECYGVYIRKDSTQYTYLSYVMWSEAGGDAPIQVTKITDESNFMIKMHFDAYEDATIAYDAHDLELKLDVSKVADGILMIDGKEYKKVVGDPEQFYLNLF